MDESKEEVRGDVLVDQLCYVGATLRDQCGTLFIPG